MSEFNEKERPNDIPAENAERRQAPPAPPAAPVNTGQYWSSRDARSAKDTGAGSPHNKGQSQAYPPYGAQNQGQYRPPYQYSANTGWQNSPPENNDRYEWNFEDYDKLSGNGKKKKRNRGLTIFAVSILSLLTIALVGLSAVSVLNSLSRQDIAPDAGEVSESGEEEVADGEDAQAQDIPGAQVEITSKPQIVDNYSQDGRLTIPQVASMLLPSVVSVETYLQNEFYEPYGLGSGIIMNEQGYIITNQHVVADADAFKVTLNDGNPYEAKLIGSDVRTDLAVLKIEAEDLTPAEFGNSEELLVGETVIAIGNPAGLELAGSVTQGIVSALNRQVNTGTYSMTDIQTDAAINPGNSGGALVNEFGQVVGINTAKIVDTGFEGIGFAIPISEAKPVIDDLIANGRVTGRVMLGITAQAVDEVDARRYDVPMGLRIVTIDPSSDLGRKGVQTMDIITHIEGERIYTYDDLRNQLDNFKVGDTVRLTLYRQTSVTSGNTFNVSITLIEDKG